MTDLDAPKLSRRERQEIGEARAKALYPSVTTLNWHDALKNDAILFRLLMDIADKDGTTQGHSGRRPPIPPEEAGRRIRQLMGYDYVSEPFPIAFRDLVGSRSITNVTRRTGLNRSFVFRLLRGETSPSPDTMEKVAAGFGKQPWYFSEYRISLVTATCSAYLEQSPETSMHWVRQLGLTHPVTVPDVTDDDLF